MISDREKVNNVPISIWFLIKFTTNFQSDFSILFISDADKIRFTVTYYLKHKACPRAGLKHAWRPQRETLDAHTDGHKTNNKNRARES